VLVGGEIFCTDVAQLTIQNNIVITPDIEGRNRTPFAIQRGGDSIIINGNLFVNDSTTGGTVIALTEVNKRQVARALVADNLCFARSGRGILCEGSDDVMIQGNMIVATGTCLHGIRIAASANCDMDNISLRDNDVLAQAFGTWVTGIQVAAGENDHVHYVSIIGNSVGNATEGIEFAGNKNGFKQTPVCALNRIDAEVASPLVGLVILPGKSLVVGGAASRGGAAANSGVGRLLTGLDSPEGKVTGSVGDIFQRLDVPQPGETSPSNLYIKTSGDGTNAGWTAK
jgi:hypothetical protein